MESAGETSASRPLTPERYYRLPWNLADNAITWLEPTTACNIYCEGCYRENTPNAHTPLDAVIEDLEAIKQLRKTDGISIAGGEPLTYPHIVELVRYVAEQGWKPIVNSNGHVLTPELVRELADAGLFGFTFHVDSHQRRPGWIGKTEEELNTLRLKLAEMCHTAGKGRIACAFNATIYRDTLKDMPMLTEWAQANIDRVQTMVYILFRCINFDADRWNFSVNGEVADPKNLMERLVYTVDESDSEEVPITAQEVADKIREVSPGYEPCAFLNGTEDPRSMKWLLSLRVGNRKRILGHMDPKFIEMAQSLHHLLFGTYVGYSRPSLMKYGQALIPLAMINRGIRKIFLRTLRHLGDLFRPMRMQALMIIQPVDIMDGHESSQ
jgi:organic radical activating enzyme